MVEMLPWCVLGLLVVVVALQALQFFRKDGYSRVERALAELEATTQASEQALRKEIAGGASADTLAESLVAKLTEVQAGIEQSLAARHEEAGRKLDKAGADSLASIKGISAAIDGQKAQLLSLVQRLDALVQGNDQKLAELRQTTEQIHQDAAAVSNKTREEVTAALSQFGQSLTQMLAENTNNQRARMVGITEQLTALADASHKKLEVHRGEVDSRLKQIQSESAASSRLSTAFKAFGAALASDGDKAAESNHVPSRAAAASPVST